MGLTMTKERAMLSASISNEELKSIDDYNIHFKMAEWGRRVDLTTTMPTKDFLILLENSVLIQSNRIPTENWDKEIKIVKYIDANEETSILYEDGSKFSFTGIPYDGCVLRYPNGMYLMRDRKYHIVWFCLRGI